MKKLWITALIILLPAVASADYNLGSYTTAVSPNHGDLSFWTRQGEQFNSGSHTLINQVSMWANRTGAAVDGLRLGLWSDSGGHPGSLIVSCLVPSSSVPTVGYSKVTCDFTDTTISASTQYYVIAEANNGADGTVYSIETDDAPTYTWRSWLYNSGIGWFYNDAGGSNQATLFSADYISPGGGGPGTSTPPVSSTTNTYIFLITSMLIFLAELFAILVIMYIIALIVGWPVKALMRRIKQLLRRSEYL